MAARFCAVLAMVVLAACGGGDRAEPEALPKVEVTAVPTASAPPNVGSFCLTPAERTNTVRFASGNGATLTGVVLGEGPRGVVFAHQSPGTLCDWMPYGRVLVAAGYQILSLDLNGNGGSTPSRGTPTNAEFDLDVAAAVGVLRGRGVDKIVLMGASLGGAVVVKAAAVIDPPVAGVISLSAAANASGSNAVEAARHLAVPALFLAAEGEPVATDTAKKLHAAAPKSAELKIYPGTSHGTALLNPEVEPRVAEIRALVAGFIERSTAP
jgi:pimeloyl-ACP methyl ester carboxylesterase